jgi:hypothetical protein
VVAVIGILMAIAFVLYANVEARARLAKAQTDVRTLAGAVVVYTAHVGSPPAGLADLTSTTVVAGISAGPFVSSIPCPPTGWSVYTYAIDAAGFSITTAGDSTTVKIP